MPKSKATSTTAPIPVLTSHQKFTYQEIPRSSINVSLYNPRRISDRNRKELRKALESLGMVEGLVWNRRTGNLVGGHQRLSILDQLEGKNNYLIGCNVIDVDEVGEKTINISLNNPNLQGTYDGGFLFDLLQSTPELKIENAGFSIRDLELEFGEVPKFLVDAQTSSKESPSANSTLTAPAADSPSPSNPSTSPSSDMAAGMFNSSTATEDSAKSSADAIQAIKDRKKQAKQDSNSDPSADADYYLAIMFRSSTDKEQFLAHNSLLAHSRHVTVEEIIPLFNHNALWRMDSTKT